MPLAGNHAGGWCGPPRGSRATAARAGSLLDWPHAHRSGSRHFFKAHPRKSRSQGPAPGIKNRSSNNVLHLNRIEGFQLHLIPLQVSVCHQCSIGTTREDDQQRRILHYLEGVYNGFPTSVRESAFAQNQTRSMPLQVRHSIPAISRPIGSSSPPAPGRTAVLFHPHAIPLSSVLVALILVFCYSIFRRPKRKRRAWR